MRIWRRLSKENGIALIVVLGTLTTLSIAVATATLYTTQNVRNAERSSNDEIAFSLTEAGLANAMAVLSNPSKNALDPDTLPSTEATASSAVYEEGTAKWYGTLDRAAAMWTVTSIGLHNNPTGPSSAPIRRKLVAKVPVIPTNTQNNNNPAWNYVYARATGSTCDVDLANNLTGSSQFYVAGNLCLRQNVGITSPTLIVRGNLDLENNAYVGVSTDMTTRVETYVGGSCRYAGGAWAAPCSGDQDARRIFSKKDPPSYIVGVNSTAPVIPEPEANFAAWYEDAIPGPAQSCTTLIGTPPTFDNDYPNRNNSVSTAFELTPATSYTCRVGTEENPSGLLAWNASTRMLTVAGTMYIDGSAKITNGFLNTYSGQGTLYLSGTFVIGNNSKLCGGVSGSNCDFTNWNPNTTMLTVVANGSGGQAGTGNSILMDQNGQYQGGLFATHVVDFRNNSRSDGPIVGSTVNFNNNVHNDQFPTITVVPSGMPGNPIVYAQPNPPQLFAG